MTTSNPIDLLWSKGAAYNIGLANALTTWASAIATGKFIMYYIE